MSWITLNVIATALNLGFFAYNKNPVNLGCAVISGSMAFAIYFFPPLIY